VELKDAKKTKAHEDVATAGGNIVEPVLWKPLNADGLVIEEINDGTSTDKRSEKRFSVLLIYLTIVLYWILVRSCVSDDISVG
jgi:hypothetical protein